MQHIIESGKSEGWQGSSEEELSQIKNILSKFNIFCVDDFVGEWGRRIKERAAFYQIAGAWTSFVDDVSKQKITQACKCGKISVI